MSIAKSIINAYIKAKERYWDTIYWAIDLHGVCLKSTYSDDGCEWINEDAKEALKLIRSLKESNLIMWTSSHLKTQEDALKFFDAEGIYFDYGNENPNVWSNKLSCFDKKFYFSILLDDKAGFDPNIDWKVVTTVLTDIIDKNYLKTI